MRLMLRNIVVTACALLPVLAFAQPDESVTTAQVHAQLVQLERAGYNPHTGDWLYPDSLKRAEAKVARQEAIANTSYGPAASGTAQSGK